jgi:hypothetical protein
MKGKKNPETFGGKWRYLFMILALVFSVGVSAQKTVVKGNILDRDNLPVIGANIKEKETGNGTITDINGNFSLSVGTKSTIIISYIGYITKEVPVGNNTSLTVQLAENTKQLDEVVVTALGIKREEKAAKAAQEAAAAAAKEAEHG